MDQTASGVSDLRAVGSSTRCGPKQLYLSWLGFEQRVRQDKFQRMFLNSGFVILQSNRTDWDMNSDWSIKITYKLEHAHIE